ncbi:hypothetical protein RHMOL_Rhmol07G0292800 [Rhododendron molle]|uniref:Uncharacterized protein n=2 Tax=Rhododendron molle TaxID=49168 RepID=A0ACC0N5R2_RHOML|nr:hypothetical protein RHMOL_Rhmol07G0292800 [Rhododendron molle]KAI8548674.1 hypothetical protein RHMOL_Rhmol07G0292800 [Rhododendron molle]
MEGHGGCNGSGVVSRDCYRALESLYSVSFQGINNSYHAELETLHCSGVAFGFGLYLDLSFCCTLGVAVQAILESSQILATRAGSESSIQLRQLLFCLCFFTLICDATTTTCSLELHRADKERC